MATKFSIKLFLDKRTGKLLFAEAQKDFVDFLLTVLTLPLWELVKLTDMPGCLGELFDSLPSLNKGYFRSGISSGNILNAGLLVSRPNSYSLIKPSPSFATPSPSSIPELYYVNDECNCLSDANTSRCRHYNKMTNPRHFVPSTDIEKNGYVNGLVTYMVMDDLSVAPLASAAATIAVLSTMTMDLSTLQEKVVDFGAEEAFEIFKASLKSKNVLTDVFLNAVQTAGSEIAADCDDR